MTKSTRQYVADVKRRLGISSDYALAKALGITRQGATLLSRGDSVMSTTTAAKVAEILELDALQVIADAELERGSSPDLWKRIRAAAAIAGALIAGALLLHALGGFNNNDFAVALSALALPLNLTGIHIVTLSGVAVLTAIAWLALERANVARLTRSYGF